MNTQNKKTLKTGNELLRSQLNLLQEHLDKVMNERDVLRHANKKKHLSIVSFAKRLKYFTNKMKGQNNETH